MKKVTTTTTMMMIATAMVICSTQAFCSRAGATASEDSLVLSEGQKRALTEIYDYSCDYLDMRRTAETYDEMIQVIRVADIKDDAGDVIAEIPEYDEIKTIVWPNGYRKY